MVKEIGQLRVYQPDELEALQRFENALVLSQYCKDNTFLKTVTVNEVRHAANFLIDHKMLTEMRVITERVCPKEQE